MRSFAQAALTISLTTALLAGCGGSQPSIGTPGAIPQAPALAARTNSTNYKVVYSFGGPPDAGLPGGSLIDVRGTLYGTTSAGGTYACGSPSGGCGTVFRIRLSGKEKVLYAFVGRGDGIIPDASLLDVDGTFYGTTSGGGSYRACGYSSDYFPCGTVFSVTMGGTEKVLHSFGSKTDGIDPVASLIDVNGTLYGTTSNGGAHKRCNGGCGTVFSITPSGTEKVLHSFGAKSDGTQPLASLIEVKGKLYGTTEYGGAYGLGTVFSITLSGREKVLHSFDNGTDGTLPNAGLVDVDGTLYGTTLTGGEQLQQRRQLRDGL